MARADATGDQPLVIWGRHLATPGLPAAFGVGFCILFAFVGTFSYMNFVLARPPIGLGMTQIGLADPAAIRSPKSCRQSSSGRGGRDRRREDEINVT